VKAVSAPAASLIRYGTSGKEIEQVCLLDAVAGRQQGGEVPCQRGRIARNVSKALRPEFHQQAGHPLAQPGAGGSRTTKSGRFRAGHFRR